MPRVHSSSRSSVISMTSPRPSLTPMGVNLQNAQRERFHLLAVDDGQHFRVAGLHFVGQGDRHKLVTVAEAGRSRQHPVNAVAGIFFDDAEFPAPAVEYADFFPGKPAGASAGCRESSPRRCGRRSLRHGCSDPSVIMWPRPPNRMRFGS